MQTLRDFINYCNKRSLSLDAPMAYYIRLWTIKDYLKNLGYNFDWDNANVTFSDDLSTFGADVWLSDIRVTIAVSDADEWACVKGEMDSTQIFTMWYADMFEVHNEKLKKFLSV